MERNIDAEEAGNGQFGAEMERSNRNTRQERESGNSYERRGGKGVTAGTSGEGSFTKELESITSKIPSATFLGLAMGSIGLSLLLRLSGRKEDSQFIGEWVPTILIMGLYNKLVKLEGSE